MNIFTCGDMHGRPYDTHKVSSKEWKEQKTLTKEDVLVQLGDFGWIWYEFGTNKEQEYWLDWLAGKKYTLAVLPGNHENYDIIETLPFEEKWGAPVRVLKRETGFIYFLERGYVYTINGKKIFAFGGARSNHRPDNTITPSPIYGLRSRKSEIIEGKNWWKQEMPTKEEFDRGRDNLEAHGWKVDWIFAHTCPSSVVKELDKYARHNLGGKWNDENITREDDPVSVYLEEITNKTEFKYLCFGHFHLDWSIDLDNRSYMCFYKDSPLNMTEFDTE